MPPSLKCRKCGGELPIDAPEGNCPACLLQLASQVSDGEAVAPLIPGLAPPTTFGASFHYFGDYELFEEIARGGMGVVFRGRQVSLNRPVALKMILAGQLANQAQLQRFQLEAEAAARLDHPNIVPIYEVGVHEGQHYYSMKLIEGGNLAKRLAGLGRMAAKDAAELLAVIARAVHFAHQHQIVHRDLKPTNILVDADGIPHVTDFGLAKMVADDEQITGTIAVLGTPCYMAPEQATGHAREITTSADVHSLGAILYELLSGRPPFRGATALETLRLVSDQEAPRLSEFTSNMDRDLETICLKCLQKKPNARYGSAQALANELDRWIANEPILARPAPAAEKLWRWARRKPAAAGLFLALFLLLVAVAIGSTVAALRIRRAETAATEKLYESYLAQARAQRLYRHEGQRFDSLAAVKKAAAIHPSVQASSEAIASLALADIRFLPVRQEPDPDSVCYDPSLHFFARNMGHGEIVVRRCSDQAQVAVLTAASAGSVDWFYGLSSSGRFLAAGYTGGTSILWDLQNQKPILQEAHWRSAAFSADGDKLIISGDPPQIQRFHLEPLRSDPPLDIPHTYARLGPRPQSDQVAGCVYGGSTVELRDLADGSLRRNFSHPSPVTAMTWSPTGATLAVGCENGTLFLWDPESGEKKCELQGHQDNIVSVGFSHSGQLLGSSSWDGHFRLWDPATAQCLLVAAGYDCSQVLFEADDNRIGCVQRGPEAGFLEIESSRIFSLLTCPRSAARGSWGLDISPDGRLLAAASENEVRIWDLRRPTQSPPAPASLPAGPSPKFIAPMPLKYDSDRSKPSAKASISVSPH